MFYQSFQYISCYCLSFLFMSRIILVYYFNTSHVTVYLIELFCVRFCHYDFNTSHVTVYRPCNNIRYCYGCIFQYISCYCLSNKDLLYQFQVPDFNTSHVTVYRTTKEVDDYERKFQYISCYCLSIPRIRTFSAFSSFQYISCYCLSLPHLPHVFPRIISIHLMLLFI